ncbi:DNA polymerase ligase N-terminal domain-containing protein [Sulfurimonas sp. HSL3-7]|uniref:DNA polymerase ligase N-terminal domain-containing protein n=1 Tax=Sulfonitrofixus jiaomeiensis TaxID=3131938 RepID=UPI0031F728EA
MPIFVVQKHSASTLHYDFRLEIGGVLKSWALPKGPSLDPHVKRLAVPTDDHPLAYGDFEGSISEGHYGAGEVIIWDRGNFENISHKDETPVSLEEAYEAGHISFELKGQKLRGKFTLLKTRYDGNWLLLKQKDGEARENGDITKEQPFSVGPKKGD